ncbi:hypothetical protein [Zavarzinella formosa]|uniref:hypothetical protein n=1 Tax=Zavarzinella formosa TaxID=360055 RepID=UPI000312D23B|nr:hypothetical protein [Zavarzinella formosa]
MTTATGSGLNSNDIVRVMQYPDPTTGNPSTGQQELKSVNALGQTLTTTDRNGTVHTWTYDVLGRSVADAVTTLGSGVDDTVLRVEMNYDTQGNLFQTTTYDVDTGGDVVNQIQRAYNGLGQLIAEYQAVDGEADTGTTPKVQYAYSEMEDGANHSRLTLMTYPNGRELEQQYASGLDDSISRLTAIVDDDTTLEGYAYLGLGGKPKFLTLLDLSDQQYVGEVPKMFSCRTEGEAGKSAAHALFARPGVKRGRRRRLPCRHKPGWRRCGRQSGLMCALGTNCGRLTNWSRPATAKPGR